MVCPKSLSRWQQQTSFVISLFIVVSYCGALHKAEKPSNIVSVDYPIDLDAVVPVQEESQNNRLMVKVHLKELSGRKDRLYQNDSDDEEDIMTSGSGSGDIMRVVSEDNEHLTLTQTPLTVKTTFVDNNDQEWITGTTRNANLRVSDFGSDDNLNKAIAVEEENNVDFNRLLNKATWTPWSDWFIAGETFKVRVRICSIEGKEISEAACGGVWVQIKSCHSTNSSQCGQVQNISTLPFTSCGQTYFNLQVPSTTTTSYIQLDKPSLDICQYSLYDTFRHKYIFSHRTSNELTIKSKIKKWCDKSTGQYIVMATPKDHCRRYFKDLCKMTEKCRQVKKVQDWSNLADGCWRYHTYGDTLPAGFSNYHPSIYLLCQHFAAQSKLGKVFQTKETYFVTLYDTRLRSPVFSMSKITQLGDDTWPETDRFIERGLIEEESEVTSLFQEKGKGMLTMRDLERCSDNQDCDLRLRQILPSDYEDPKESDYIPTHLMWPELMPQDPQPKLSTFTLTNMAPLHSELFEEWHEAIVKVRQYAIKQCGIQTLFDIHLSHFTKDSIHGMNKSLLFVISGVVPSQNPVITTGRNINVPYVFWFSGCCVRQHSTSPSYSIYNNDNTNSFSESFNDTVINSNRRNVTSFSIYIHNLPGSHVKAAPVHQLELLLRENYRFTSSNFDLSLFPGDNSTCSDLRNDVSYWFQ